MTKSHTIEPNV